MSPRRRAKKTTAESEIYQSVDEILSRPKRSGKTRRRLIVVGLIATALVLAAPNLVGWLGLYRPLLHYLLADFRGDVEIRSLSVGWFQPLSVSQLRAVDDNGSELLRAETLRSKSSLLGLVFSTGPREFSVTGAAVDCQFRPGGSNWEDALAAFLEKDVEPNEPLPRLLIQVTDSSLQLRGQTTEPVSLSKISAAIAVGVNPSAVDCTVDAVATSGGAAGPLALHVALDPGSTMFKGEAWRITLDTRQMPVATVSPILERLSSETSLRGTLTTQLNCEYSSTGSGLTASIESCEIKDLKASSAQFLGSDQIELKGVQLNGRLRMDGQAIAAEQLTCTTDIGQLFANGLIPWQALLDAPSVKTLVQSPLHLEGSLDLARLANMLPGLTQLRDDVRLQSGELRFIAKAESIPDSAGLGTLRIQLDSANIAATRQGQSIVWQQPLHVDAAIGVSAQGLQVDALRVNSEFLQVEGSADAARGSFRARGDLQQLLQRASQFVDVSGWELAGRLDGQFQWNARAANDSLPLSVSGTLTIADPMVVVPGFGVWQDQSIQLTTQSQGRLDDVAGWHFEKSQITARVGNEQLTFDLADPIDVSGKSPWRFTARGQGSLSRWLTHVGALVPMPRLQLEGQIDASGTVVLGANSLSVGDLAYRATRVSFDGYGMSIREPEVTGNGQLDFDWQRWVCVFRDTTLVASTIAARAQPFSIEFAHDIRFDGNLVFRTDTQRLVRWFGLDANRGHLVYSGQGEGWLRCTPQPTGTDWQFEIRWPELVAARRSGDDWQVLMREPNVSVTADAMLSTDWERLDIREARLTSPAAVAVATGSLSDLSASMTADVRGSWRPDWQRLQAIVAGYAGQQLSISGQDEQSFSIRGPLAVATANSAGSNWPADDLEVRAQLGWRSGEMYQLPVGPGALTASLNRGVLTLDTGRVEVSGGTIQMAPAIDLRGPDWRTVVSQGKFAKEITLSPEVCRHWIKYFAPILADVTTAQGRFSMQTAGATIPLTAPSQMSAQGAILLHDVTVGPGPLGQQLLGVVNQLRSLLRAGESNPGASNVAWIRMSEQTVPFTVREGRIYHSNLEFNTQDVVIRTRGSVGFDQSLSLTAELVIADRWVEGQPVLAFLKGKSLQIPIGGTLSQPRVDEAALKQLFRQIVQPLAANQLQGLLEGPSQQLQQKAGDELNRLQGQLQENVGDEILRNLDRLIKPKRDQ